MSGKWYAQYYFGDPRLAHRTISVGTLSVDRAVDNASNRSQKCKSTDSQSKNKCSLSHKETMMTWVSPTFIPMYLTDNIYKILPQMSFHLYSYFYFALGLHPWLLSMYICSDLCILNPFQTKYPNQLLGGPPPKQKSWLALPQTGD